ncbi:hypothetical protein FRC05_010029 [Tulasnella sp. 425]|nr:hypothetical protein FRC05_010029 [Tulasnella sp. 425]
MAWEDVATGTNPNTTWTAIIRMGGQVISNALLVIGSGSGTRKKEARNLAAREALVAMGIVDNIPEDE